MADEEEPVERFWWDEEWGWSEEQAKVVWWWRRTRAKSKSTKPLRTLDLGGCQITETVE
jgi:hypothetical protein